MSDYLNEIATGLLDGTTTASRIGSLSQLQVTDDLTINVMGKVCVIAAIVASICFLCALAYNYIRCALANIFNPEEAEKFPDYMKITKGLTLITLISIYPIAAIALTGTIEMFNKMSSPIYSNNVRMAELAESYTGMLKLSFDEFEIAALQSAKDGKIGSEDEQISAEMQLNGGNETDPNKDRALSEDVNGSGLSTLDRMLNPVMWVSLALQAFAHLCFGVVRIVITTISLIVFKVLIIVGPLAIAFSILPVFEKQLSIWFGSLLTTGFVFTTLNILDMISLGMFEYIINGTSDGQVVLPTEALVFDVVLLVVYLSAFWLTGKFVGRGDAGKILSKMVAIGTAAAAVMTGGASVIGGGNLGNVISAGQNSVGGGENK